VLFKHEIRIIPKRVDKQIDKQKEWQQKNGKNTQFLRITREIRMMMEMMYSH
jgi:hypothetical protein